MVTLLAVLPRELWAWSQETTTTNGTIGLKQTGATVKFNIESHGCLDDPCFSEGGGSGSAGVAALQSTLTDLNTVINPQFTITNSTFSFPSTVDSENGMNLCSSLGKANCIYFFKIDSNNSFGGIAAAFISFNPSTGAITNCDILFDDKTFNFSTTGAAGAFDIEGVANQEVTHCLGMDHSAVAGTFSTTTGLQVDGFALGGNFSLTASMFPFADFAETQTRSLESDDEAGLLTIYPPAGLTGNGSISGQVINGTTGQPVKGAHVVAVSTVFPNTPIVGSLSGVKPNTTAGSYQLDNLPPGNYYVRIEPLVGTTNSFTEANTDSTGFDTSFPAEFYGGESSTDLDFVKDGAGALVDAQVVPVVANADTPNIDFETNVLAAPSGLTATADTVTPGLI
jgi:hypothetical protein